MKWVKQYRKKTTALGVIRKRKAVMSKVRLDSPVRNKKKIQKAPKEKAFNLCNGISIKSVKDLMEALKNSDDNVFYHHVNEHKNDFSAWLTEVLHEQKLATDLSHIKDKHAILAKLETYLAKT